MFAHDFVRDAYLAGTCIALACGVCGWFVVLRGQVFAGDALGHVAFVGAIAAAAVGVDERVGLFALTLVLACTMAGLGRRAQADDVTIGVVFSWILGLGVLCIALLSTSAGGGSGVATANTLFGSIFGLSASQAVLAAAVTLAVALCVIVARRPLLLATLDPEIAAVRGVPARLLGVAFLLLLAVLTAEGTQAVGALLLLGLLAAPAGAAHQLTVHPYRGLALSSALAVGATWAGLALSYAISALPPSSAIIGIAAASYVLAGLARRVRAGRAGRRGGTQLGLPAEAGPAAAGPAAAA